MELRAADQQNPEYWWKPLYIWSLDPKFHWKWWLYTLFFIVLKYNMSNWLIFLLFLQEFHDFFLLSIVLVLLRVTFNGTINDTRQINPFYAIDTMYYLCTGSTYWFTIWVIFGRSVIYTVYHHMKFHPSVGLAPITIMYVGTLKIM